MNRIGRLVSITKKKTRRVIGIMSGTSVDGIDAALTEIRGSGARTSVKLLGFRTFPFPAELRSKVFRLFDPKTARVSQICHLDFVLGELFAAAANRLIKESGYTSDDIDVIGTAGQTIWHAPVAVREEVTVGWLDAPIETRSTLAIGQAAVIAERTGVITVGDLRVRDVAAGGQGAPLIAYADWVLLRNKKRGRSIQNIGGIGNVTYLPPNGSLEDVIAFDTGPGNMVIDALTDVATGGRLKYDRDGRLAAKGRVNADILAAWMEDPYFAKEPPKTTGREHFGVQFAKRAMTESIGIRMEDLIATATALTAWSIASSYERFIAPRGPIDEVVIGGGGSRNPTLLSRLGSLLPGVVLLTHEDLGIDSRAKEAIAIAIIANDALLGLDTNVSSATGARPTVLGKICL